MRNQLKIVFGTLSMVAMLGLTSTVQGIPAFARQTGLDCTSCHASPGYPTLNTFGQAFKAGGYTQANEDNLMGDGEALSIPKALNMAVVFKMNDGISLPNGGKLQNSINLPDELSLFTGGRVAKNIGYLIEMSAVTDGSFPAFGHVTTTYGGFKIIYAPDLGPVKLGIVPFFNDGVGPSYAFETLSTSNAEMIRITEAKEFTSAQAAVEWGNKGSGTGGTAAGVGIYLWHPMGFVAYTPFVNSVGAGTDTAYVAHYIRAAVTPSVGGIDMAVGFTGKYGSANSNDPAVTTALAYNYMAVDAQVMGNLGLPLALVVTYANDSEAKLSAVAVALDAQLVQDTLNLVLGYNQDLSPSGTNNAMGSNAGLAVKYQMARNVRLHVDAWYNMQNKGITIMPGIFGAF